MNITAKLDKQALDALTDDDFAVPGKRKLRINDARHTRLAWHNVEATQGLTLDEKAEARRRIISRAVELDIDTRDWHKLKTISLEAMALNISTSDHPNKMPFSGILTRLDEPSDYAPGGSHGRRIVVTSEAAEKALSSLLGMAVDFTPSFDGHDAQAKIGIITSANVVGNAIAIEGFIYAADFPETAQLIKDLKNVLGFSFEAQRLTILDPSADVLTITDLAFTGAAILRKEKAAYTTTSLAASAKPGELNMSPEELKALLDAALKPVGDRLGKLEASAVPGTTVVPAAVDVEGAVKKALEQHAEVQRLAAAQADATKKAIDEAVAAATKPLVDKIAAAETAEKDRAEKARLEAAAPERKTIPPVVTALLARASISLPEGGAKMELHKLDEALKKSNLSVPQRIQLKNELSHAGVL
jgi:hypothetical protein